MINIHVQLYCVVVFSIPLRTRLAVEWLSELCVSSPEALLDLSIFSSYPLHVGFQSLSFFTYTCSNVLLAATILESV